LIVVGEEDFTGSVHSDSLWSSGDRHRSDDSIGDLADAPVARLYDPNRASRIDEYAAWIG